MVVMVMVMVAMAMLSIVVGSCIVACLLAIACTRPGTSWTRRHGAASSAPQTPSNLVCEGTMPLLMFVRTAAVRRISKCVHYMCLCGDVGDTFRHCAYNEEL